MDLLQSQINPHFLYNTLSGIASLALRSDNNEVGEFINHLSQFYKTSLNQGKEFISIREEVKITKHYVALQNMRFKDKFIFHWDIDESVYGYQTLKLLLQPFIENIVNHAIRDDDYCIDSWNQNGCPQKTTNPRITKFRHLYFE